MIKPSELLNNGIPGDKEIIDKVFQWCDILNPIRNVCNFPIKITDGVRLGDGTSQHYFKGGGAVDLRPWYNEPYSFITLGDLLIHNPDIYRVCYYMPGQRFKWGGFHVDKKPGQHLWIDDGIGNVDWRNVEFEEFMKTIAKTKLK